MNVAGELLDLRLSPGARGHVECWSFKASEPSGRRALWVETTVLARAAARVAPVAETCAIAFDRTKGHVATKSTVPLTEARFAHGTLDLDVDGCSLSLGRARGALATGWRRLAWDLVVGPARAAPIVQRPSRSLHHAVTPLSDARASGSVLVHRGRGTEERWDIDAWPCTIRHDWGRRRPHLHAWTHCNAWDVADLVFEGASARVRMGPVLSPMLTTLFVRFRGRSFDLSRVRGMVSLRRWEATASHAGVRVACEMSATTDDFVGRHASSPTGKRTYALGTALARARLELSLPDGERVTATADAAALEIGTRDPAHGVRMYV